MSNLYLISSTTLPSKFHGAHAGYFIRPLAQSEKIAIEDKLFDEGEEERLGDGESLVIIPNVNNLQNLNEYLTLTEFAFSIITNKGYPSFSFAAIFSGKNCVSAQKIEKVGSEELSFIDTIDGNGIAQWLQVCMLSRNTLRERMHITADRFVRYVRSDNIADGLMDLCISLESLIDSQTEVSFRFGVTLSKVIGDKGTDAEENANLLSELYTLRSKIAHGDPKSIKLLNKIEPKLDALRELARRIITSYVLFMSKNSHEAWKSHLRSSLFS